MVERGPLIVVGAGPGLGTAVAERFAAERHPVGLTARRADALQEAAGRVRAAGAPAVATAPADAGDDVSLRTAIERLVHELGEPQILVYNAAVRRRTPPTSVGSQALLDDLRVDVGGAALAVAMVVPAMLAREGGTVILTGGGVAVAPVASETTLSVGKAALRAYALALADELRDSSVHAATVTIRGVIGSGNGPFDPAAIAERYWELHVQPRDARDDEVVVTAA